MERLANFDPADLDAALAQRAMVKTALMRITLHVVHAVTAFHRLDEAAWGGLAAEASAPSAFPAARKPSTHLAEASPDWTRPAGPVQSGETFLL